MSANTTYSLAHTARAKLLREASRPDHNLRRLVGHANLFDSLLVELDEDDQESSPEAGKHNERLERWAESIFEDTKEGRQSQAADSDSSSDSDDESDAWSESDDDFDFDEDAKIVLTDAIAMRRVPSTRDLPSPSQIEVREVGLDDEYGLPALERTISRRASPLPELIDSSDDDSEDESGPRSPPPSVITFFGKEAEQKLPREESFYSEPLYQPPRSPTRLVSRVSVF